MITIYINVLLSKYIQCLLFSNTSIELLQRVLGNLTAINLLFLPKAEKNHYGGTSRIPKSKKSEDFKILY